MVHKKSKNILQRLLNRVFVKNKKGEVAVEWTILAPLILFVVFFCIMYLIFVMDKILYSNASSDLAQELNLGDSGFKSYADSVPSLTALEYELGSYDPANGKLGTGLYNYQGTSNVNIYCTSTPGGYFETAFYYHLKKFLMEGRMDCPFATLKSVECRVYNGSSEVTNFSVEPVDTESGDMIEITITYRFLIFEIDQKGYSFII